MKLSLSLNLTKGNSVFCGSWLGQSVCMHPSVKLKPYYKFTLFFRKNNGDFVDKTTIVHLSMIIKDDVNVNETRK